MNESDIAGRVIRVTNLIVHTGGACPFTCVDIPVSEAEAALDAFADWLGGARGATCLDVTGMSGTRSVFAFSKIVMLRAGGERRK